MVESDGVPLLVKKCVQIIEERGLKTEGVYRVSGKKEDIMSLQEKYDEGTCNLHGALVQFSCYQHGHEWMKVN